mgnify:CR=1 FL=1
MGALMLFVFNPIIGVINDALANLLNSMGSVSKVILGIVLGGMMAIDMGGPINRRHMYSVQCQSQTATMI